MSKKFKLPAFGFRAPRAAVEAIGASVVVSFAFIGLAVLLIETYGTFVFISIPFAMGLISSWVYSKRSQLQMTKLESLRIGWYSLLVIAVGLLIFAFEGIVCLVMAAPLGLLFNAVGALLGRRFFNKRQSKMNALILTLLPLSMGLDLKQEQIMQSPQAPLRAVVTAIDIAAPPEVVWESVIRFPQLPAPQEALFQMGISYPTHAEIVGQGVGAMRNCYFSTGAFKEPITVWDRPFKLAFDVIDQPDPMTELTFWKIHPPHLEGYFVSKRGQFELQALPGGKTRLIGTTWYMQRIYPEAYWSLWTDYIIHSIHQRVLNHIQTQAQKTAQKN